MTKLLNNMGLKRGDVISYTEVSKISHGAGTPNQYFEDVKNFGTALTQVGALSFAHFAPMKRGLRVPRKP
jgi:hypothetical protein